MYLEALKSKQKEIFNKLRYFPKFYLVGGTALALQIGHRRSVDFDMFYNKKLPDNLLPKIRKVFNGFEVMVVLGHPEQTIVKIDGVKMDFVKYTFPLVYDLIDFKNVKMATIKEIAAMKAYALNYRGTYKDYVDLYFILKEKYATINQIKKIAEAKYKEDFNFRLFLEQLIYLEDFQPEEIEFLRKDVSKEEMKRFFEKQVRSVKI